jgi:epoxyqueuosine reductase
MVSGDLTTELSALATRHGAVGFGVAGVAPFERERSTLVSHRRSGFSGPLRFTFADPDRATDVTQSFPWARHLVVVASGYLGSTTAPARSGPQVGRFAMSDQYVGVRRITSELASRLRRDGHRAEVLSDDNRLVDRAAAVRAGVGWSGKSTMTLVPGHGPWVLLGSVVTDAPLAITEPMSRSCGTCIACIPACPTAAISERGLDARRCLSTWLQTPGSIPHWIRPLLGRRIYGCDDCLAACPPGQPALSRAGGDPDSLDFGELLAMSDEALLERFHWWYVPRRDGRYLRRNLLVAAGNSGEPTAREPIEQHMRHPSSMIRSHAGWAMARSLGSGSAPTLRASLESEASPETREELALALLMIERPDTHRVVLAADEWGRENAVQAVGLVVDRNDERLTFVLVGNVPSRPAWAEEQRVENHVSVDDLSELDPRVVDMIRVYDPDRGLERLCRAARRLTRLQVDRRSRPRRV